MNCVEWLQELSEVKNWSNKIRQALLHHIKMTSRERVLLKNYQKEFAWIHQVLFSTDF